LIFSKIAEKSSKFNLKEVLFLSDALILERLNITLDYVVSGLKKATTYTYENKTEMLAFRFILFYFICIHQIFFNIFVLEL
jgi:hypothetical protein